MITDVEHELSNIRHGDHICLTYQERSERQDVVIPYLAEGLARGERCIYTLEDGERDELLADLHAAGVNVGRAIDRGALWLRTSTELYRPGGKFDPDEMLAYIEELIRQALADGFTGVRGSGETASGHESIVPWETIMSYEARVNEWFSKRPFVGLCRYRRAAYPPSNIHDVLRTHPVAIVRAKLCRNPYFEKADVALASNGEAARVDWMLRQLRWSRLTEVRLREMTRSLAAQAARLAADNQTRQQADAELERAVRMRDRLLAILAKELAVPVAALSDQLATNVGAGARAADGPDGDGTVGRHLRRLGSLVEELRTVSRLTNRQIPLDLDDVDLVDVARQMLLRQRDQLAAAGCALTFHAEPRIQGTWDRRRVEQLLGNLIATAIRHGARRPIAVDLVSDADSARASIRFCGVPLSPDDEERLFEDRPMGLWSARDIAGALGGTVEVTEAPAASGKRSHNGNGDGNGDGNGSGSQDGRDDVETTLTLELPRAQRRPPRPDRASA